VAQAAIAAQVHQTLDVHRGFAAEITFDGEVRIDVFADRQNFGVGQLIDAARLVDADGGADLFREERADAVDIGQSDGNPLCSRDVDASNTCQTRGPLRCASVMPEAFFTTRKRSDTLSETNARREVIPQRNAVLYGLLTRASRPRMG
jgi:hypothetical protein